MQLYAFSIMVCQLSFLRVSGERESTTNDVTPDMKMLVDNNFIPHSYVVKKVEDTLNLTCIVYWFGDDYEFTWNLPKSSKNSKNRVLYSNKGNSSNLIIQHLQESDTGDYRCEAVSNKNITSSDFVTVNVKSKKLCGEKFFTCQLGNCIQQRFVCDGRRDCRSGEDETEQNCGFDPCLGKIMCDGRCIPVSWCCHPYSDLNCTVKSRPSCCQQLSKPYIENNGYVTDQQRFSNISFLQTTIYTVIGCAMVFMLVVTIFVVAICKVHMKRSLITQFPPSNNGIGPGLSSRTNNVNHHLQSEQHIPLYDLDVYLNRSPGLLVTYNINNGVQFVGHPVNPPPYCEVVASPPREGPPPPYVSREDLENEALLCKPICNTITGNEDSASGSMNSRNICSQMLTPSLSSHVSCPETGFLNRRGHCIRKIDCLSEDHQPLNTSLSDTENVHCEMLEDSSLTNASEL